MTDTAGAPTREGVFVDANADRDPDDTTASSPTKLDELTTRQRTQQRLIQARTSAQAATARARSSARSLRHQPADDSGDAPVISIVDRAQAYRTHIVGAAAAVTLIAGVILRRRAKVKRVADTVDLGEWRLHADAVGG